MKHIPSFKEFVFESTSGEILNPPNGRWIKIDPKKHKELSDEFFNLIHTAYQEIGGHAKITKPNDVFSDPDWTYWSGVDIHGSPDLDVIVWGQNTKYGIKFSGVGHDGEKDSKKEYLNRRMSDLHKIGYYGEISGKLSEILIGKHKVPTVDDQAEVEKVIGKNVKWYGKSPEGLPGNGWYSRNIGGHEHLKILVGRPRI